jgi:hypothetical protein
LFNRDATNGKRHKTAMVRKDDFKLNGFEKSVKTWKRVCPNYIQIGNPFFILQGFLQHLVPE